MKDIMQLSFNMGSWSDDGIPYLDKKFMQLVLSEINYEIRMDMYKSFIKGFFLREE